MFATRRFAAAACQRRAFSAATRNVCRSPTGYPGISPLLHTSSTAHADVCLLFQLSKVTILGAAGGIGQPLSLLMKLNPRVTELALYDIRGGPGEHSTIYPTPRQ